MNTAKVGAALCVMVAGVLLGAQEKPVPKDSVRIFIPGCAKGQVFTVGPRTADEPGRSDVAPGMHFRLSGSKKLLAEIKAHQGTMVEVTGLVRKGQLDPSGLKLGDHVRIGPGPAGPNAAREVNPGQIILDVEGWRQIEGNCPSR